MVVGAGAMEGMITVSKKSLLVLTIMVLGFSAPAFADKAMLVFDASGSMWGQIGGKSKIQIAREVVGGLLDGWPENTELGLMAYGHREKDNCSDIQTLVSPAPKSWPAIKSAIGDIDPKGKTPITEAVRAAAKALRSEEGKATVILVSDGLETCSADPCAAAAELEKAGVDFTVHVVGFGTNKEENRQLQCLADNTGGRFLGASNASELKQAMSKTVELIAKPEPPAQPVESKKNVVKLQVGWLRLDNSVRGADVYGQNGQKIASVCTGCGEQQLPSGTYRIKADGFDVQTEIKAGAHQVVDAAAFAGRIRLDNSADGADIYDTDGQKIARLCTGCGEQQLAPGTYRLKADGIDMETVIKAGDRKVIDAATHAGWLMLDKSMKGGVDIYHKDGRKIGRACAGCGKKQLPPGTYQVKGDGFETEIEIKAGQESLLEIGG
jgi:hypothetical protein